MGRTQRARRKRKSAQSDAENGDQITFVPDLFKYLRTADWRNETQLTVRNFPLTGRGLCSKARLFNASDELLRLPLSCLLTEATLETDEDFKRQFDSTLFNKDHRVTFHALMALYLLHHEHLGNFSPYKAYLNSLPANFTTPYFCPVAELQCLPEIILERTVAQNRQIRDSFALLKSYFSPLESCQCCGQKYIDDIYTLAKFKWAFFVVNTRSVYVDSRLIKPKECFFQALLSDGTNLALAPFLDLFNHADNVRTEAMLQLNATNKQYEFALTLMQLPQPVQKGRQLFISYGAHTNLKLLLEYGFFLYHNVHDYFEITLLDLEHFIKQEKSFHGRIFHRNKFKFIRDHNLHDQMFMHITDGASHNLLVVLHLLFKEESYFPNVLNQVAFGAAEKLANTDVELRQLLDFKMSEYCGFIEDLQKLPMLSASGTIVKAFLEERVEYLKECFQES